MEHVRVNQKMRIQVPVTYTSEISTQSLVVKNEKAIVCNLEPNHQVFNQLSGLLLAKCMATRDAHIHGTTDFNRELTPESDLSTSSAEDKNEEPSRLIFAPLKV